MIKSLWEKWKEFTERTGNFQFNILFSVLYYLLVVPVGLVANLFGDFLKLKGFPHWDRVEEKFTSIKVLKEQ